MSSAGLVPLSPLAAVASALGPHLDTVGPTGPFDSLRATVCAGGLQPPRVRGSFLQAFPRPGEAVAAAGLVLASATLSSLGLLSVGLVGDTVPVELGLQPAITELAAGDPSVAVVPPPGPPPAPDDPEGHGRPAPPVPAAQPASVGGADAIRMHRVSPTARPAPAVVPAATAELAGEPRLNRLARHQVLAAAPLTPDLAREPGVDHVVPARAGALPLGVGMWLYVPEEIEGGNVDALVARAEQVGLTHVYVRTGSSRGGFYAQPYMDELLPKAHAAGIRVYGWDFPYLEDVDADVSRALAAVTYTTPSGDRLDGFAADIETASEGTNLSAEGALAYAEGLRAAVGGAYPLVAVVPRPSPQMQTRYPYQAVVPHFDAVAPMTYWLNRQPETDVVNDVNFLSGFGKPVIPIGQAYDGGPEGGRPGSPPPEEIQRFLAGAQQVGAAGTSFWSWQHANQAIWDTLQAAPEFRWEARSPAELRPDQIRGLQAQLTSLGHAVPVSGTWDDLTTGALRAYQEEAGLGRTGILDESTLAVIMKPFNPPVAALAAVGPDDQGGLDLGVVQLGG